jgi:hypothetical protein
MFAVKYLLLGLFACIILGLLLDLLIPNPLWRGLWILGAIFFVVTLFKGLMSDSELP